jgi:hypothetical protein
MNAPFVLLSTGLVCSLLTLVSAVDACAAAPLLSPLADGLSRNMLATFLVANVLTGAVNLSTNTLAWGDGPAAALLVVYMLAVAAAALALQAGGFRLRL